MTLFVDTNWLVATYFKQRNEERSATVARFMRRHDVPWVISHLVWLEAKNVLPIFRNNAKRLPRRYDFAFALRAMLGYPSEKVIGDRVCFRCLGLRA
jgi:hypothetical protein